MTHLADGVERGEVFDRLCGVAANANSSANRHVRKLWEKPAGLDPERLQKTKVGVCKASQDRLALL